MKQRGFTLVELMVTLAVAIILLMVGMPMFSGVASNNRAAAQTRAFVTALAYARSEAVTRGTAVSMCPSSSAIPDAAAVCGDENDWGNGWLVFTDNGTVGTIDGSDERLRIWDPAGAPVIDTSASLLRFNYLGSAGSLQTFAMHQPGASSGANRCITLSFTGQIQTANGACP